MTVTIEVKPEMAHRWKAIAEREGRALDALITEVMEERAATLESATANPLRKALAMVQARDARATARVQRTVGSNDAASELRQIREEQTP